MNWVQNACSKRNRKDLQNVHNQIHAFGKKPINEIKQIFKIAIQLTACNARNPNTVDVGDISKCENVNKDNSNYGKDHIDYSLDQGDESVNNDDNKVSTKWTVTVKQRPHYSSAMTNVNV